MSPASVCLAFGGVASRAELVNAGVTRTRLARAVERGEIIPCSRGLYAHPSASFVTRAERIWRGRRTCVTALAGWGLPAPRNHFAVHLAVPAHRSFSTRRRQPRDVRLHWVEGDLDHSGTVIGALDVSALCLADVDQLAAIDAALNRGLVTTSDLVRLAITPASRARWLRQHCDSGCQSPPETYVRVALREAGLPVRTQVSVPGVGRVDFVVDGAVVVEVDGKTYHMNERAFWEDRRRDRVTQIGGMMALRFTREDVEKDLAGVVAEVAAAVALVRQRTDRPALRVRTGPLVQPWVRARAWPSSDRRKKWRMN